MAKVRVHELAKELGITSKEAIAKLSDLGEFVRSASSTIEAPAVKKLKAAFPKDRGQASAPSDSASAPARPGSTGSPATAPKPGMKAPAPKPGMRPGPAAPAAQKPGMRPAPAAPRTETPAVAAEQPAAPTGAPAPVAEQGPVPGKPAKKPAASVPGSKATEPAAPAPGAPAPAAPAAPRPGTPGPKPSGAKPGAPRPGNNPFAPSQGMPRPASARGGKPGAPRPGNNPFAASQGMPKPSAARGQGGPRPAGPRQGAPGAGNRPGPRPAGAAPARPGAGRPSPNSMPQKSEHASAANRPGGAGGASRGRGPGGTGPAGGGGGFGKGGRGRGGTAGAFGKGGSKAARQRKSKRAKRQEMEQMQIPGSGGVTVPRGDGNSVIRMRRGASLTDFADKINANPAALVTVLFHLGEMATATQSLDEETFQLLGAELGYVVEVVSPEDEDRELLDTFAINLEQELEDESDEDLTERAPVVTVMGHVDHGKTRLLDAIRDSDTIDHEHGGITQHIGAYQIHHEHEGADRLITFIDTPGHEAFTAMRARGAKVTDIAVLVVAADDGVMPQTVEALNHAQSAGVPIVVAVNKVDKDGAQPEKIRGQLTEYGLVAEEYGGDTMFVDVSAKQGVGIDELIEAVLLTADAALDLRANANKDARGVAIEANLDKGRGAVSTVLVQSGTLRVGDAIVAGTAHGRVRAMFDEHGETVPEAYPSRPVQVLGLTSVPRAGDTFLVTSDERTARHIAEKREAAQRNALLAKRRKRVSLEDFNAAIEAGKIDTLNLVLKGDVSGAVEALEDALMKIDVGEDVQIRVIHRGVGAITQNDVNLATVDNAVIIGFNVRPAERVAELADREGVDVRYYSVIYRAIEEIENTLKGMLKPEYEEVQLGSAEVREVFRSSKFGNIAGCLVQKGEVRRNSKARLIRDGAVVAENLSIDSLKRFKDDATEVREGYECGIGLGNFNDIKPEDVIETYEMREKPRV